MDFYVSDTTDDEKDKIDTSNVTRRAPRVLTNNLGEFIQNSTDFKRDQLYFKFLTRLEMTNCHNIFMGKLSWPNFQEKRIVFISCICKGKVLKK